MGDMGIDTEKRALRVQRWHVGLALIACLVLLGRHRLRGNEHRDERGSDLDCGSALRRPHPVASTGLGARAVGLGNSGTPKGCGGSGSAAQGQGCYGERIMINNEPTYQFTSFSTTGAPEYRVDGYEQALGEGMSLAVAKADVLKLMPSDTRVTAFWITHENGSCVSWNLKSATLGRWFSGKKVGDPQGAIGVDLNSLNSNDESVFDPNDVSRAIVGIGPEKRGTSC